MKSYLVLTGIVFGLIVVAHLVRLVVEGTRLIRDPVFDVLTLMAALLSAWAWRLTWRSRGGPGEP